MFNLVFSTCKIYNKYMRLNCKMIFYYRLPLCTVRVRSLIPSISSMHRSTANVNEQNKEIYVVLQGCKMTGNCLSGLDRTNQGVRKGVKMRNVTSTEIILLPDKQTILLSIKNSFFSQGFNQGRNSWHDCQVLYSVIF